MKQTKVIIIGAGAAGLMAAKVLKEKGIEFVILEATNRVGGRARTLRGNPHIEYGPEYLHGDTPLTDELVERFGLTYYDVKFDYHIFKDGTLKPIPDFWNRLCGVLGSLKIPQKDLSFADYLRDHDHHSFIDQELSKMFVEGFDAADLNSISTRSLNEMKDQVCNPKVRRLRRLLHGYGELFENMAQDLLSSIYFSYSVDEIQWKENNVIVRGMISEENIPFEFRAEKIIDTVSVALLKKQKITPRPEQLDQFLQQTEMGQVVKLVGEFHPEFFKAFKDNTFPFVSAPELCLSAWWSSAPIHLPIVTAWAGGARARKLIEMTEDERKVIFIEELAKISSSTPEKIKSQIINIHHHNWSEDPYFLGAYSYPKVHAADKVSMVTSYEQTLYFAGEAFHEEMSGTIEGAFATGKQAAEEIASIPINEVLTPHY